MQKKEKLSLLLQDVDAWNKWREKNPGEKVSFVGADLSGIDISGANLWRADLSRTNLSYALGYSVILAEADLSESNLWKAQLGSAALRKTNFSKSTLSKAMLSNANLQEANLSEADLTDAELIGTKLSKADLSGAKLLGAQFHKASLYGATVKNTSFRGAEFLDSSFALLDLSSALDLDRARHLGPSAISTSTLMLSEGEIPEKFLRGCGLSDWEIEATKLYNSEITNEGLHDVLYRISELRAQQPFQFNSLFISYSHADAHFVDALGELLDTNGIRYWRDVHHSTAGPLEKQIDRAIRQNDTLLLVLSENSVRSDWVEYEVGKAHDLKRELGGHILCPIALDDAWEQLSSWSQVLMKQVTKYNVLDFSKWQDTSELNKKFKRLLDGLNLFYAKPSSA